MDFSGALGSSHPRCTLRSLCGLLKSFLEIAGALAELSGALVDFCIITGNFQKPSLKFQELVWTSQHVSLLISFRELPGALAELAGACVDFSEGLGISQEHSLKSQELVRTA